MLTSARRAPQPPDPRGILARSMVRIEDAVVQWSASGRLNGGVAVKANPARPKTAPSSSFFPAPPTEFPDLERAVKVTRLEVDRADETWQAAEGRLRRARAALAPPPTEPPASPPDKKGDKKGKPAAKPAAKKGGKKPKGELSETELKERLATCEDVAAACKEAAQATRATLRQAEAALADAQAVAAAAAKRLEKARLDARLRQLHFRANGRHLPCRLPFVLDAAREQVSSRADELHLSVDDLSTILGVLRVAPPNERLLNSLFKRIERDERESADPLDDFGSSTARGLRPASASGTATKVSFAALRQSVADYAAQERARRPPPSLQISSGGAGGAASQSMPNTSPVRPMSAAAPRTRQAPVAPGAASSPVRPASGGPTRRF